MTADPKPTADALIVGVRHDGKCTVVTMSPNIAEGLDLATVCPSQTYAEAAIVPGRAAVAANDLLAVCEDFAAWFRAPDVCLDDECHELFARACAATAKAKGETNA